MITSPFYTFEVSRFNDGTPRVRLAEKTDKVTANGHATVYWYYDATCYADELFQLGCIKDLFADIGVKNVTLIMPYIPNARMDRKQGTDAFTLRTFAKMINAMDFDKVIVFDPHSDVAPALIDRCEVHSNRKLIDIAAAVAGPNALFVFPDAGAEHRYGQYVSERIIGAKQRDWNTQMITGYTLVNGGFAKGRDVVVVDDIVSKGYTLKFLLDALMKYGPRSVTICCSHLEDAYFDGALFKEYPDVRILTTNSIIRQRKSDIISEYVMEGLL